MDILVHIDTVVTVTLSDVFWQFWQMSKTCKFKFQTTCLSDNTPHLEDIFLGTTLPSTGFLVKESGKSHLFWKSILWLLFDSKTQTLCLVLNILLIL